MRIVFRQIRTLGRKKPLPQPRSIIVQNVDRVYYKVIENKLYLKKAGQAFPFVGLGNLPQFEKVNSLEFDMISMNVIGRGYHDCNFNVLKVDAGNNMFRAFFDRPVEAWIYYSQFGEGHCEIPVPDGVIREGIEYL